MSRPAGWPQLCATLGVAGLLWFTTFALPGGGFWMRISLSAATLAVMALVFSGGRLNWEFRGVDLAWGLGSAAVLYALFWGGNLASGILFDFAPEQIGGIYARGAGTDGWVICALLLFVTGPAEELYWRGFLQQNLARRLGGWVGWGLAAVLYALVHLPADNFMLLAAAALAGAFWGLLYRHLGRVAPLIISHSLWSAGIFVVAPLR